MQARSRRIYRFDRFELDAHRRQLWCEGQLVTLQPKALDLLVALVESDGNVLTKDELLNLVWPGQVVEESNLTVHMSALRKALGERKGEHRFVVTQPGRGYRFVADVDDVHARTDAGALLPTPGELPLERPRARVAIWLASGSMLCAVLIAGAVAYWRGDIRLTTATSASGAAAPEMTIKRLTTSGRVSTATLSPDGKFFAYVHRETDGQYSLWLNHVEGSGTVRLLAPTAVTGFSVTFAPDGTSLFYCLIDPAHPQGQLFRSPLLGGTPENLGEKRCGAMAFSPDGKKVAFVQPDSARAASLVAGGKPERLRPTGNRRTPVRPDLHRAHARVVARRLHHRRRRGHERERPESGNLQRRCQRGNGHTDHDAQLEKYSAHRLVR